MNISTMNAIIRIACGSTILAWATSKLVRKPLCFTGLVCAMCGGIKIGTGIFRYCPITALVSDKKYRR
ncbi:YgaP family membrane protein [Natribacillus halophilus]|uniref:YgaP family membrane protein n=1 Tax=Natribacillus halophilus TaxID=549003 RepID=UPI000B8152E9|nr:DUF2892 domain-containing protein [Natribacillus halophilus]